jgi:hypothetical protein
MTASRSTPEQLHDFDQLAQELDVNALNPTMGSQASQVAHKRKKTTTTNKTTVRRTPLAGGTNEY